jgi:hypothetical protein
MKMKRTNCIQTKQGRIGYIQYKGFTLVPKLNVDLSDLEGLHDVKLNSQGRIIYALPGGGEFIGPKL